MTSIKPVSYMDEMHDDVKLDDELLDDEEDLADEEDVEEEDDAPIIPEEDGE